MKFKSFCIAKELANWAKDIAYRMGENNLITIYLMEAYYLAYTRNSNN